MRPKKPERCASSAARRAAMSGPAEAVLTGIAVQNDIFEDHDGIVDDQTDGSGEAAQCHQVETLIGHFQDNEGNKQSDSYDQARHKRSSPIAQEQHENDGREQNADEHGIAYAGD